MKKICFLTLAAGLAAGVGFGSVRATGPWEMAQQTAPEKWMPAVVPGTVLTTLVKNGLVPDPYWGLNNKIEMRKIPDLAENRAFYEAMFRTKVELPVGWTNRVVWMRPEGINYRSEIYLNGYLLRRAARFLNRKSQRRYRLKFADTYYGELNHYGMYWLKWTNVRRAG